MPTTKPATKADAPVYVDPSGGRDPAPPPGPKADLHRFPASNSFILLAHPTRMDVFQTAQGYEILPVLREFHRTPGANGVRHVKGADDGDATAPIAALVRNHGWIEIPADVEVEAFGEKYRGYVHVYDGANGPINLVRWNRLYRVGSESYLRRDPEGYHVFLRKVRDEMMPPTPAELLEGLRARLEQMERAGRSQKASPAAQEISETMRGKLSVFVGGRKNA